MEERLSEFKPDLPGYLHALKAEPLYCQIIRESDGKVSTVLDWENVFCCGEGQTLDDSISDMILCYREMSEIILENPKECTGLNTLKLALKCAVCNEEEIKRCLVYRTCEDI